MTSRTILTMANGKGDSMSDSINHPSHYKAANGIEAIDVVEGFDLGFRKGNAVTYILRAGRKVSGATPQTQIACEIEDLKKAAWYIAREIANRQEAIGFWNGLDDLVEKTQRAVTPRKKRSKRK